MALILEKMHLYVVFSILNVSFLVYIQIYSPCIYACIMIMIPSSIILNYKWEIFL